MAWHSTKNLVAMPKGNFRSILGYAGESLAIGRALVCGYNLFFKAWRDAKYDAVLDANGCLFRVEIKQTSGTSTLSTSAGGRAGKQINRDAGSREAPLCLDDCDFILGVQSLSGLCWIVPVEIVQILDRKQLPITFLKRFEEKWSIFTFHNNLISNEIIRDGFSKLDDDQLEDIFHGLQLELPETELSIPISSRSAKTVDRRQWMIISIWFYLFDNLTM